MQNEDLEVITITGVTQDKNGQLILNTDTNVLNMLNPKPRKTLSNREKLKWQAQLQKDIAQREDLVY